jgi:hypothetical protein
MNERDATELRILEEQLRRMRGMLGAYSARFFQQITRWGLACVALLALSTLSGATPAAAIIPFLVPFAVLEAGYTFYYTVFARRHAEFIERTINARFGRAVLPAHRLEAAYFYPADAPKLAFFSFGRVSGYGSVMTLGYSVGAVLLWGAGAERIAALTSAGELDPAILPGAVLWTLGVTAFLLWHFLGKRDERRLLAELKAMYPDAVGSRSGARRTR